MSEQSRLHALAPFELRRAFRWGAIAWIASVQFFIAQLVVQSAWKTPFSLTANYISDLGNTACGPFPRDAGRYVCSPWHAWMNASFVLVGLTIVLGAALIAGASRSRWPGRLGLALIALAGLGFIAVGVFPENVNFPPHRMGAALQFVCGNLGQAVLGGVMLATGGFRTLAVYSLASGMAGLLATALFVTRHHLGAGLGGMERLAAYPLPAWSIVMGLRLWATRVSIFRARDSHTAPRRARRPFD